MASVEGGRGETYVGAVVAQLIGRVAGALLHLAVTEQSQEMGQEEP